MKKKKPLISQGLLVFTGQCRIFYWRRGRDSNPRYVAVHLISSQAPSTTRTPLRKRINFDDDCNPGNIRGINRNTLYTMSEKNSRYCLKIALITQMAQKPRIASAVH